MTRSSRVTVAIPVLDGERHLAELLPAVSTQAVDREVEILIADSGSRDGSVELARTYGARVIEIPPGTFSHGGTRNLLFGEATGDHVAFLTQDATPASEDWLARLLAGFGAADDVGLVYGPYVPRATSSASVRRELTEFFHSLSPSGEPRVDRLDGEPLPSHPGPVTFFTDANACIARSAWERVPFREAPYAEDQLLAREMLAAGFAKVYEPRAAVLHSHDYPTVELFRRFFDEWRGLREVYGHVEEIGPRRTPARVVREVRADREFMRAEGAAGRELRRGTRDALRYHGLRAIGSALGSRADRLPARLRAWCSLEGRATFEPQPEPRGAPDTSLRSP